MGNLTFLLTYFGSFCFPSLPFPASFPHSHFRWGCCHEKDAIQCYTQQQSTSHTNLVVERAGLFVSLNRPYIEASPDSIVTCDCCGKGTLEVKCPFCFKDELPEDNTPKFCMSKNDAGEWKLSREHAYYYQVQVQLNVCNVKYGDFILWTENGLAIERIIPDQPFTKLLHVTLNISLPMVYCQR